MFLFERVFHYVVIVFGIILMLFGLTLAGTMVYGHIRDSREKEKSAQISSEEILEKDKDDLSKPLFYQEAEIKDGETE